METQRLLITQLDKAHYQTIVSGRLNEGKINKSFNRTLQFLTNLGTVQFVNIMTSVSDEKHKIIQLH